MKLLGRELFLLSLAIVVAGAIAGLSLWNLHLNETGSVALRRSVAVLEHVHALLSCVKDAETGQRGYVLTGKEAYLAPFQSSNSCILAEQTALDPLMLAPEERRELAALKLLIAQKLDELQASVRLRREQGFAPALALVETDHGHHLMEAVRSQVSEIVDTEAKYRQQLSVQVRSSARTLGWVGVVGALFLVGLLFVAQGALRRNTAKRVRLIGELKDSRDQTAAARDLFEITLQSIGDAVIASDAQGCVTFINPVAQRLTGWKDQSAIGEPAGRIFRIIDETSRALLESPIEAALRSGRIGGLAGPTLLLALDGSEIPIDDSAAPIRLADGKLAGAVLVFRDISERRRVERELQNGRGQLEQSNAALARINADLELFSYAAGHDLQEPLRTLALSTELLVRRIQNQPDVAEHAHFIQSAVRRMRAMIDGLLHYSRLLGAPDSVRSPVDLAEVMREVLLNLQLSIGESGARVEWKSLPSVCANRQQMVQLFQNLVSNGIKYRDSRPPHVQVECVVSPDGSYLFSVRDNGIGIDTRFAGEIFKAFHRLHTQQEFQGTGLGLAMCKRIVELHGGRLWVESEPGAGSDFRFTLAAQPPD